MKQILKDVGQALKELAMIPLGIGMWAGGVWLAGSLTRELGVKDEYAGHFIIIQAFFLVVTLNHFFGKKEAKHESK
jgi:hypothetical protein